MSGLLLTPEQRATRERIKATKTQIENLLQSAYPNHLFQIEVTERGDCFIDHLLLRHSKGRFYFHVSTFMKDEKTPVRLAGELLERVDLPREGLQHLAQYNEADLAAREAYKAP